jgi:hypothetical protein
MNWVLLSFAVITPMSSSIGMAFKRREQALEHLAVIKSTLLNIYSAHACWDWAGPKKEGRAACEIDWLDHNDHVLDAILRMCSDIARMLTLPSASRARHRVTAFGRIEAKQIESVLFKLHRSVLGRFTSLTDLCEVFKRQGLPPNEATRIRQWERFVVERIGPNNYLCTIRSTTLDDSHAPSFDRKSVCSSSRTIALRRRSAVSRACFQSFSHPFMHPFTVKWPGN